MISEEVKQLLGTENIINVQKQKVLDNGGFDPPTSRMLSVRSTNWASRPLRWTESAVVGERGAKHWRL